MSVLVNPYIYGSAVASDPFWANVVLLCHFDGTNGQSNSVDSSTAGHVLSHATCPLTTAQAKFGPSSIDMVSNGAATTPDSADWDFGAGQFTLDLWARPSTNVTTRRALLAQWQNGASTNLSWVFWFNSSQLQFLYSTNGTSTAATVGGASAPTAGAWYHIAADRDASNVLRLYVNGAVVASATVAATFFNSTRVLYIGNEGGTLSLWQGQIDEVRITKGVARYGGAFTPPIAAFPNG